MVPLGTTTRRTHLLRQNPILVCRTFSRSVSRKVQLNPLYIAAVNRPHLATSLAFGVPLIDRTETVIDHQRFAVIDPLHDALDLAIVPATDTPSPSLRSLMLARGDELWREAMERGCYLDVLWSGGIDSTATLVALLQTTPSDEQFKLLRVKFAPRAVHENRFFYQQVLEKLPVQKLWITHGQVADAVSDEALTVTGEGGDRDKSDWHFRGPSTENDRKSGLNWLSCTSL
jgi:hypothetical protein